jgi:quinohemoprotein amine dehydrogenase
VNGETMTGFRILSFASATIFAAVGFAQSQGIPINDALVIAKCGSCHTRDASGMMQRLSFERTTPEAWQEALKRMVLADGVALTPVEARSIVKYLSTSHGLAPEEAKPVMYDVERRVHEETNLPSEAVQTACTKCHSFARALSWRRSPEDWATFAEAHAANYKVAADVRKEAVAYLVKTAPLHTPEWDAYSAHEKPASMEGRWLLTATIAGRGTYYGEMQVDKSGDDEYTTRSVMKSVRDGSALVRVGRIAIYGGSAWRGRSKGEPSTEAPDSLGSDGREVMRIDPDQATVEGRWFWGQYQEFGFDVKLRRPSSGPTLLAMATSALKAGSQGTRIHVLGNNFPTKITSADFDFGPGVTVASVGQHSAREIVLELNVAADAALGAHTVKMRDSPIASTIAIYDRIDYLKVTPDTSLAAFGEDMRARGYQQFDAIGFQRGPDGKPHTADDVDLGVIDVTWSIEAFYDVDGSKSKLVGSMSTTGLFTPAVENVGSNIDTFAIATAVSDKDTSGKPLTGKGYLVVTVPSYVFNGHRYVRDLDRWVDDGPAETAKETGK